MSRDYIVELMALHMKKGLKIGAVYRCYGSWLKQVFSRITPKLNGPLEGRRYTKHSSSHGTEVGVMVLSMPRQIIWVKLLNMSIIVGLNKSRRSVHQSI